MGENSKIEWTDHTFNPWIGCQKISPACDHCYAEAYAKRTGQSQLWLGERRRTSKQNWRQPLKWDFEAGEMNVRKRVFCASLADVFDNAVPAEWRQDLGDLIQDTENLDWLLLTKRVGNAASMLAAMFLDGIPDNVWLGATVVDQVEADRDIPKLLDTPARVRFLSIEPMLDRMHVGPYLSRTNMPGLRLMPGFADPLPGVNWVIVGGESGPYARAMNPSWARSIRDQCAAAGVPFLFKQWGEWAPPDEAEGRGGRDFVSGTEMAHYGKKRAGRLLDGIDHREFPF